MLGGRENASVDQIARIELRSGFLSCTFESQLWKLSERRMGRDGAVVEIGGGMVDCRDDEVVGLGDVLDSSAFCTYLKKKEHNLLFHRYFRPRLHSSFGLCRESRQ